MSDKQPDTVDVSEQELSLLLSLRAFIASRASAQFPYENLATELSEAFRGLSEDREKFMLLAPADLDQHLATEMTGGMLLVLRGILPSFMIVRDHKALIDLYEAIGDRIKAEMQAAIESTARLN